MKKSIYTLLFLTFVLCLFNGLTGVGYYSDAVDLVSDPDIYETNAFRLIRQVDSTGKIGMAYVFPVNSRELALKGYNETQIKRYKFYLTTYVNAFAQSNKQNIVDGMTVDACNYYTDVDGIGFSMIFDNIESQNEFYGTSNEESPSKLPTSSGFFFKITKTNIKFPFSEKSAGDLKMICIMATSSWANDLGLSDLQKAEILKVFNESKFIYDFGSTQSALKSELMYDDENFHHNIFIKNIEGIKADENICFWTVSPNYPVWYASALIVVLLGMLIAFVVIKIKKKG